ncbi:TIGR04076 family protein [Christensenellaceae bacterium OttesenSCG-928-M15]|nr:TIGR04076 family protein [Christensenellaceae bacterium OttesenSCG-928-M15]
MGKMYKVNITVLKRDLYPELAAQYLAEPEKLQKCPTYHDGQKFVADGFLSCPEGFCAEAWQAIWPSALAISRGGTFAPYTKDEYKWVCCCTDGLRPVSFLLERGEEM